MDDDLLEAWVNSPVTQSLSKSVEDMSQNTLQKLINAAIESSDSSVRAYAEAYHQQTQFVSWLRGEK